MFRRVPAFGEKLGRVFRSIRFRIVLWFTVILAIILCAFSGFLYFNQSSNLQGEAIRELNRRITAVVDNVQSVLMAGGGQLSIPKGILLDTDVFTLVSPTGQVGHQRGTHHAIGGDSDRIGRPANHTAVSDTPTFSWIVRRTRITYSLSPRSRIKGELITC